MSNAETTSTTETSTGSPETSSIRLRRAGRNAAALSVGFAAAALATVAAPSTAADDAGWAMPSQTPAPVVEPLTISAEERAAQAAQASRSAQREAAREAKAEARKAKKAKEAREAREARAAAEAEPTVIGTRYTTAPLNVRTKPKADTAVVAVLAPGTKIQITDQSTGDYRQVLYNGDTHWVTAQYLSKTKPQPKPAAPAGPSMAACASSAVESGLTSNAVAVHRAVCNAFPSVTSYGGVRSGGGAHGAGRAVDIMVTGSTGDQIAAYLRANAGKLGVSEVIWEQKIWTVQRSSEGWRWMPDRGSATANHYDHVHVTVY